MEGDVGECWCKDRDTDPSGSGRAGGPAVGGAAVQSAGAGPDLRTGGKWGWRQEGALQRKLGVWLHGIQF